MLSLRSIDELRRVVVPFALALLLNACGGGGGGGGGGGQPQQPNGSFTISATSATFTMIQGAPAPSQTINLTVTAASGVAGVGAAFPASQGVPPWLTVGISGTMPNFVVSVQPNSFPVPGHYTATLLVGTGDASGNVLQSKSIAVTLDVSGQVVLSTPSGQVQTSFIFGHSSSTLPVQMNIQADNATWTMTSNVPWIVPPAGNNTGSQVVNATVDASTLAIGSHNGRVTVQNTQFPTNSMTLDIVATVVAPTLTITTPNVVLGGADGLSATPQPFTASLNTGSASYPFAVVLTDDQSLGWMQSSVASGTVSELQSGSVNLSFDRTKVTPGSYNGTGRFDVTVKGVVFSASTPVKLNVESHRLYPEYDGVALSKFPSRSRLTRSMHVLSSRDKPNVPWTATSDQAWLTVTPAGVTGDTLTLTANAALVPSKDQSHFAFVTLASTDPTIDRTEKIRVGVWVSDNDPVPHLTTANLPGQGVRALAVNPVDPLVYSVSFSGTLPFDSNKIRIHNIYTGDASPFIDLPGTEIWSLGVSSDGRLLFAFDHVSKQVFVMNAATGAAVTSYPSFDPSNAPQGFLSMRPNGFPMILTPVGEAFDTETHERIQMTMNGNISTATSFPDMRAVTVDGKRIIVADSVLHSVALLDQHVTVLGGGKKLEFTGVYSTPNVPIGNGPWDMALAGQHAFINDSFDNGQAYEVGDTTLTPLPSFPVGPGSSGIQSIESTWDGRVFFQVLYIGAGTTADNVFVFDQLGNSLGSARYGSNRGGTARSIFGISDDLMRMVSSGSVPNGIITPVENVITFDDAP